MGWKEDVSTCSSDRRAFPRLLNEGLAVRYLD
jgi:hypothetical protein